jgi:hypothetical protein
MVRKKMWLKKAFKKDDASSSTVSYAVLGPVVVVVFMVAAAAVPYTTVVDVGKSESIDAEAETYDMSNKILKSTGESFSGDGELWHLSESSKISNPGLRIHDDSKIVGSQNDDEEVDVSSNVIDEFDGNRAPTAVNDFATYTAGVRLKVDVLANDYDPDGDEIYLDKCDSLSDKGFYSPVINDSGIGKFIEVNPNMFGITESASFPYTIRDRSSGGKIDTARVTIVLDSGENSGPEILSMELGDVDNEYDDHPDSPDGLEHFEIYYPPIPPYVDGGQSEPADTITPVYPTDGGSIVLPGGTMTSSAGFMILSQVNPYNDYEIAYLYDSDDGNYQGYINNLDGYCGFLNVDVTLTAEIKERDMEDVDYLINWGDGISEDGTILHSAHSNEVFTISKTHTFSVPVASTSPYYMLSESFIFNITLRVEDSHDSDIDYILFMVNTSDSDPDYPDGFHGEYLEIIDDECCFPAGTEISMADGSVKNIEDIELGDKVVSYNLESEEETIGTVEHLIQKTREAVYSINQGLLSPTDDHPLFVRKSDGREGWAAINPEKSKVAYSQRNAMKLEIGDELLTSEGWVEITSIEKQDGEIQTYTFSVSEEEHDYFANGVLVSNALWCFHGFNEDFNPIPPIPEPWTPGFHPNGVTPYSSGGSHAVEGGDMVLGGTPMI